VPTNDGIANRRVAPSILQGDLFGRKDNEVGGILFGKFCGIFGWFWGF